LKFIPHLTIQGFGQETLDALAMTDNRPKAKYGWATWLVLAVLVILLCLAIAVLYVGWQAGADDVGSGISGAGYVAMTLGIVATLALGIGLMALIFYSNRSGRD
jgi:hypothetical protein